MGRFEVLGKSIPRLDSRDKVTGAAKFVDDLQFGPTLLYAKVLRSPYAHARIVSIDTTAAKELPGVKAVITGQDCDRPIGLYLVDRKVYAVDKVRFVGDPVAAVAADSVAIAEAALALIKVEYEELPGVFNPVKGAAVDNSSHELPLPPQVHENLDAYRCAPFIFPVSGSNISNYYKLRKGDPAAAFANADLVVERSYSIPHIQHCSVEPHSSVAHMDQAGKLTLWASSQSPNAVRKLVASAFNLPLNRIRVITPYVGGGFGGKAGVTCEGLVVPLAMQLPGYYIKLTLSREEVFQCTFVRQGLVARLKTGVTKDGYIVSQEVELYWDGGAYTEYGVNIARSGGYCSSGPYEIPNMKTDSYCVYTNHPVGGPMRGFGMPEIHWAIELQMDIIAGELGLDPVEMRKINALREGRPAAFGGPMHGATLLDTITAAAEKAGWNEMKPAASAANKARGRGIACMFKAPSMPPDAQSSAILKFNEDGTVNILTTAMEIGQGSFTALAQIAAEELGIPVDRISVQLPDTDYSPCEWQTVASRISYSTGNAVLRAARDAKRQLQQVAAQIFCVEPEGVDINNGFAFPVHNPIKRISVADIVMGYLSPNGAIGGPVIGRGFFIPPGITGLDRETGQGEHPAPFWTYGTQIADIEVDTDTGEITVIKVTAAYEVGTVINPALCTGQIQGGIVQGLSSALYEQLVFDKGYPKNNDFTDYKIAVATDVPKMEVVLLEMAPQADGPFGVKGIGEPAMVPTAPAIANALYDAVGVRIFDLPLTAEKVLAALKAKERFKS